MVPYKYSTIVNIGPFEERFQRQDEEIANLKKMVLVQHGRGDTVDSPRYPSSLSNNVSNYTPKRPIVFITSKLLGG